MTPRDPTHRKCAPEDISLKSSFLGPQAENADWLGDQLLNILQRWVEWRRGLFPGDGRAISPADHRSPSYQEQRRLIGAKLGELLTQFEAEVPKFSPRYVGHMFSEISLPALLGHIVALIHNPNNISGESSRVGVAIEDEGIAELVSMVGMPPSTTGHFTSGGTIANFEALVRARARSAGWLASAVAAPGDSHPSLFEAAHCGWDVHERRLATGVSAVALASSNILAANPHEVCERFSTIFRVPYRGPVVLVPENKHYSWRKGVELLGLGTEGLWSIALDTGGRLDVAALKAAISRAEAANRPILAVVSVAGTTELGTLDPVGEVQDLLDHLAKTRGLHIWHHVDAAYGGFFASILSNDVEGGQDSDVLSESARRALGAMRRADSVTLDPHKLGYVPYACGAILVGNRRDYVLGGHDAPYIQYEGNDRGLYTIEGSRPATGAAATWMIAKTIGLHAGGYGRILARTIRSRRGLGSRFVAADFGVKIAPGADTNVLGFTIVRPGESITAANARAGRVFERLSPKNRGPFIASKTTLKLASHGAYMKAAAESWQCALDTDELLLVRMCLLNPFFESKEMRCSFPEELTHLLRSISEEIP